MVVYAAATDVSVGRMFLGGVIPGLLAGLMLMAVIYMNARMRGLEKRPFAGVKEILESAGSASWGLLLIVIIFGGIYSGVFTPTEAAAVAAVYAFLIATLIYRDMGPLKDTPWRETGEALPTAILRNTFAMVKKFPLLFFHGDVRKVMLDGGKTTIMLMFIIVNALCFLMY